MHPSLISVITTFNELKNKEVINVRDGSVLGCVTDLEFNACTGEITAIIIPGSGLFASLSVKNRITIPWRDIERIGKDTVLVRVNMLSSGENC